MSVVLRVTADALHLPVVNGFLFVFIQRSSPMTSVSLEKMYLIELIFESHFGVSILRTTFHGMTIPL